MLFRVCNQLQFVGRPRVPQMHQLLGLRISATRAQERLPKGASRALRVQASRYARKLNPWRIYSCQVVDRWAGAVWERYLSPAILKKCIEGALKRLAKAKSSWRVAIGPVVVILLLPSSGLGGKPTQAR